VALPPVGVFAALDIDEDALLRLSPAVIFLRLPLLRTLARLSGLPSGLELLSLGVLLPDDVLDTLLFSRTMEPARGVLSPEDAALLDGEEMRKGLASLSLRTTLRSPVSMLSVSTPDRSSGSAFGGCSATEGRRRAFTPDSIYAIDHCTFRSAKLMRDRQASESTC